VAALNFEEIDESSERTARERAAEGVGYARQAGLDAEARVAERGATIWETILNQAEQVEASLIVLGSRGLTGIKSILLGSVSQAVLQHADRPVMIVPSPGVAAKRASHRH
jgi:nucleotide-binding universal stress UspA family protein